MLLYVETIAWKFDVALWQKAKEFKDALERDCNCALRCKTLLCLYLSGCEQDRFDLLQKVSHFCKCINDPDKNDSVCGKTLETDQSLLWSHDGRNANFIQKGWSKDAWKNFVSKHVYTSKTFVLFCLVFFSHVSNISTDIFSISL